MFGEVQSQFVSDAGLNSCAPAATISGWVAFCVAGISSESDVFRWQRRSRKGALPAAGSVCEVGRVLPRRVAHQRAGGGASWGQTLVAFCMWPTFVSCKLPTVKLAAQRPTCSFAAARLCRPQQTKADYGDILHRYLVALKTEGESDDRHMFLPGGSFRAS